MLGEIDGFEVLARLKKGVETENIKVIVVSALDDESSITKPYDILSLKSTVKTMLQASHVINFDAQGYLEILFSEMTLSDIDMQALSIVFLEHSEITDIVLEKKLAFLMDLTATSHVLEDFVLGSEPEQKQLQRVMN